MPSDPHAITKLSNGCCPLYGDHSTVAVAVTGWLELRPTPCPLAPIVSCGARAPIHRRSDEGDQMRPDYWPPNDARRQRLYYRRPCSGAGGSRTSPPLAAGREPASANGHRNGRRHPNSRRRRRSRRLGRTNSHSGRAARRRPLPWMAAVRHARSVPNMAAGTYETPAGFHSCPD
jgi:hypothetical protein